MARFATDPPSHVAALLRRAIALAVDNASSGQLPFGALVTDGDRVVATGVNSQLIDNDPSAHAEVNAIRAACRSLGTLTLAGTTLVSSCEPCAMCHVVAVGAGIDRIVYAATAEQVPSLDGGAAEDDAAMLAAMQRRVRMSDPARLVHVPVAGADGPFHRYLAGR